VDVVFEHWSASWPVLIAYVILAAAHLAGLRRTLPAAASDTGSASGTAPAEVTRRELRREAVMCQLGLGLIAAALLSPIGYLSDVYIWVRALQLLLVAVVGPGLIVLGAPWAAYGLTPRRLNWVMARPVLAVVVVNVIWLGWQLPGPYDAAHGSALVALAEHVSYVVTGTVFWLQLISSRPLLQRTTPLRRMALVVGTAGAYTVIGMVLVFGSGVFYPVYVNSAHQLMTVLDDQQLSGAVLWMGILLPLTVAGVALLLEWFRDEESAELTAGLDRLLAPRPHGWPSRPGIR
jgi:putative membrane protein